jgi:hypothetical protein
MQHEKSTNAKTKIIFEAEGNIFNSVTKSMERVACVYETKITMSHELLEIPNNAHNIKKYQNRSSTTSTNGSPGLASPGWRQI